MENQKDQVFANTSSTEKNSTLTLDQSSIYPPIDKEKLYPIEMGEILEPQQLQAIFQLVNKPFASFPYGCQKSLSIVEKNGNLNNYINLGNLIFEKKDDNVLLTIELKDHDPQKIMFSSNGQIQSNTLDPKELKQLLDKIFTIKEEKADYTTIVANNTMSLPYFRQRQTDTTEGQELADYEEGQELADFEGPEAQEERVNSLAYDVISNFNEAPELSGLDRQQVFQNAYRAVAKNYFDKASKQLQDYYLSLSKKKALFLKNDDFETFNNIYSSEINMQSTYAMVLGKGLILFNQELIRNEVANTRLFKIYKLLKRGKINLPDDQSKMIEYLANFIPFYQKITHESLDDTFFKHKETDGNDLKTEMLENTLWSIVYHECLHVLSANNFFLENLNEAATYYYTALDSYKEKGASTFGILIVQTGVDKIITWIKFLRDFNIDPQLAEEMYFNKNGDWTIEKMFDLFPGREKEFLEVMKGKDL
jgi:hypothetical protein